jgi:hypothetical protein
VGVRSGSKFQLFYFCGLWEALLTLLVAIWPERQREARRREDATTKGV